MFSTIKNKIKKKLTHSRKKAAAEYALESQNEIANNVHFHPLVNQTIDSFKQQGGIFNGFAIAESAMRALLFQLMQQQKSHYHVIELGGGQSTLFFDLLSKSLPLTLSSYEHDADWFSKLSEMVKHNSSIHLNHSPLRQVSDSIREKIMHSPDEASALWNAHASALDNNNDKDTRARNCFYHIEQHQLPSFEQADAIIIDGPHGNGRSMSYSILASYFKPGTLVLIDDYHHYPFLPELQSSFNVEVLIEKRYKHSNKGWVLAKVVS